MAQKRLTAVRFRKLLTNYPKFNLNEGTWLCSSGKGKPCGGCAMTLAYKDAHPKQSLNKVHYSMIED